MYNNHIDIDKGAIEWRRTIQALLESLSYRQIFSDGMKASIAFTALFSWIHATGMRKLVFVSV